MNHSCRQSFAQYGSIDKTPMMDYHKLGLISDGGYIMIRCDSHMHSAFSYDSDAEMETMIKSAIDIWIWIIRAILHNSRSISTHMKKNFLN